MVITRKNVYVLVLYVRQIHKILVYKKHKLSWYPYVLLNYCISFFFIDSYS